MMPRRSAGLLRPKTSGILTELRIQDFKMNKYYLQTNMTAVYGSGSDTPSQLRVQGPGPEQAINGPDN